MVMYYHNFIVFIGLLRIFGSIISIRMHASLCLSFYNITFIYGWFLWLHNKKRKR